MTEFVSGPPSTHRFKLAYRDSFQEYVRNPSEATLRTAYELGRDAVQQELSLLDLAIAHHEALAWALRTDPRTDHSDEVVRAAGEFFLESISAFDMVQRGFREARDAALLERRQAEMLRQLSRFLADASLAVDASGSLDEMLRLVAEQARELIPADCCLVETGSTHSPEVRAVSHPDDDLRWVVFVRWLSPAELRALGPATGHPMRMGADEIQTRVRVSRGGSAPGLTLRSWLGAPLMALDGAVMGSIHLVSEIDGEFTALHEAIIQHLAQMSAAAMERAGLYTSRR